MFFLTGLITLVSFYPLTAAAIVPGIQFVKPFGGKITKIQACQTPPGFILHIGPPVGGKYFLNPATSKIQAYGVIRPGVWTLGSAALIPINCSKGNTAGIGGFSVGGLLDSAIGSGLFAVRPVTLEMIEPGLGSQIMGAQLVGPGGSTFIGGDFGVELTGLSQGLGGVLSGLGVASSLMGGDFFGAGLTLASLFDPTGATTIAPLVFNLLGINFGKKPPSLGLAYPIIRIGTGRMPAQSGLIPAL